DCEPNRQPRRCVMVCNGVGNRALAFVLANVLSVALPAIAGAQDDARDWPMYNRDVLGTHHNKGENTINKSNAGRLEEKLRFPPNEAGLEIGVIHATPVVVDGYVYFGTATDPAFYKLTPDGKVRWSYRRVGKGQTDKRPVEERLRNARFQ